MKNHVNVSVVIPTIGNLTALEKSIQSALSQSYSIYELIVVIDGTSPSVKSLCKNFKDSRIKVIETGMRQGGGAARNIGIQHTSGEWVALLDDDDEWLPSKLYNQIQDILTNDTENEFLAFTKARIISKNKQYDMPKKRFNPAIKMSSYLFNTRMGKVNGFVQTSTFLAPREVYIKYPFNESLLKHQDWDFVINLQYMGVPIIYTDMVLSLYNHTGGGVGSKNRWRVSLDWIESIRHKVDSCAYQDFLIQYPIKDLLWDGSLSTSERRHLFFTLTRKLDFKHKLSLKQLANFKTLLFLK